MSSKRYAQVDKEYCVSCGTCTKACPLQAISVPDGMYQRSCRTGSLHRLRSVRP